MLPFSSLSLRPLPKTVCIIIIMSIDFDSAALQTQQDEEEYDQEDYAREQEVPSHTQQSRAQFGLID